MVNTALNNSRLILKKVSESTELTPAPDSNTFIIKHNPPARDVIEGVTPTLPAAIETRGTGNINFALEVIGFSRVDITEWFLYNTDDGLKWFAGETEIKIVGNKVYIIEESNAVAFYVQVINTTGSGSIKIYASGDYIN